MALKLEFTAVSDEDLRRQVKYLHEMMNPEPPSAPSIEDAGTNELIEIVRRRLEIDGFRLDFSQLQPEDDEDD